MGFMMVGVLPIAAGWDRLDSWLTIVWVFVLQGIGRGVWEGTNKAVFVEHFPEPEIAPLVYANVVFQEGLTSTLAFLILAYGEVEPTQDDCVCRDPVGFVPSGDE